MTTTGEGIIVHHLDHSRSTRILSLLEELGVPYTIKEYKRSSTQQAPKELKAIHPLGKSPVITDNGVVIAESGAIVEYLIKKYDTTNKLAPHDEIANGYYTHFAEGSLMPPAVMKYILTLVPTIFPFFLAPIIRAFTSAICSKATDPDIRNQIDMLEAHLSKLPSKDHFIAGGTNLTSADFMMVFPLDVLQKLVPTWLEGKDAIKAYITAVKTQPCVIKAIEKGGEM